MVPDVEIRSGRLHAPVAFACLAGAIAHLYIGATAHYQLRTSGFDLSVFDYALWNFSLGADTGFVPMFGYSLFAQHFMPTLWLLAPLASVFASPLYLIIVQALLFAGAAYVLYRLAILYTSEQVAAGLTLAFLLSRRTHGAATSYFYIESAEPLLIFGALAARATGRMTWYWACILLALGCKEDVSLYVATFGIILAARPEKPGDRALGVMTLTVSVTWLCFAMFVAIPYWSQAAGLAASNQFLAGRFGIAGLSDLYAAVGRAMSLGAISKFITLASATGLLCVLGPRWLAVALPGLFLNLMALDGTNQAGFGGHYLWPLMPWMFMAAIVGTGRYPFFRQFWVAVLLVIIAAIDSPLPGALRRSYAGDRDAEIALKALQGISVSGNVIAQPNLIPHLKRSNQVFGYGVYLDAQPEPDVVLLTTAGDPWPLGLEGVERESARWRRRPEFQELGSGPLTVFVRRIE